MNISVVVPLYNEEESLEELCSWIDKSITDKNLGPYEILLVDDGSTDGSWEQIVSLTSKAPNIKGIKFRRNYGKSAALNEGFIHAQGNVVITMDADLQDSPDEIPELYDMVQNQGFDLVSGWKKKRHDPIMKTIPSKFFNWVTRKMSGIKKLHDFNCGLKAYSNSLVKSVEVYGEMHRYMPVIAKQNGFIKIGEKVVEHHKRKHGKTKFGMERFINGFLDLLSIMFVTRFGQRPMHLFGTMGVFSFIGGFGVAGYLIWQKLYYISLKIKAPREVTEQPLFYLALVAVIVGSQMFLTGFLAELVSRNSSERNTYQIDNKIGF